MLAGSVVAFSVGAVRASLVDLREHRLPNRTLAFTAVAVAIFLVADALGSGQPVRLAWALAGAAGYGGVCVVIALLPGAPLGMGDAKLAGLIGLTAGYFGLSTVALAALLGVVLGGVHALVLLVFRRATLATHLPLGPALTAGAVVALLSALGAT